MQFISLFLLFFFFFGCSSKVIEKPIETPSELTSKVKPEIFEPKKIVVADLSVFPQYPEYYAKELAPISLNATTQEKYESAHFRVWNIATSSTAVEKIKWPFVSYNATNSYAENLQPHQQSFFDTMYENSNFDAYASLNTKAVTLTYVNMRLFPTIRPVLRDPSKAGEGFPFDYLQNSSLHANQPVFVSHYSKDKEWVYIFSSFASGWIKSNEIAFLQKEHIELWQKAQQVFLTHEDIALHDEEGNFLFRSKVGMMLALIDEDEDSYTLLAVSSYKTSQPHFVKTKISKAYANKEKLDFNAENMTKIMQQVSQSNYGWGGMFEQRDCSSMLRDMFAPFGIWLPRNSYAQSKVGQVITLEDLNEEEKIRTIKEKAIPFRTLLYRSGHIVLYVGVVNDEIIVFHDIWGIRTLKDGVEGRIVIGKTVFTSLKIGKEQPYFDESSEMLRNLKSMNILF